MVVTDDLPDEARLALLDLDVTADDLRGKLLRWDQKRQRGILMTTSRDNHVRLS